MFYTTPPPDDAYCPGGHAYDETSSYSGSSFYLCSASDQRRQQRITSLLSWLPLLGALGAVLWRARRRRRRE